MRDRLIRRNCASLCRSRCRSNPAGIFAAVGEAEKGVGQRFESDDGHAVLSVYARENKDGDTLYAPGTFQFFRQAVSQRRGTQLRSDRPLYVLI